MSPGTRQCEYACSLAKSWPVTPSLERSSIGLRVLNQMDAVVLVVEADSPNVEEVQRLKREVTQMGGYILGVVLNRAADDAWRAAWHPGYP